MKIQLSLFNDDDIMTTEEKAKAYDEALELMKDCIPDENGLVHVCPEEIFHELNKESEDEKIKKELIGFLRNIPNSNYTCEEMAAWLEKQDEMSKKCSRSVQDNVQKSTINIDEMVAKYSRTKDGSFGLPRKCKIRAYRQGLEDGINSWKI